MTVRVDIAPRMLEWARDRARLGDDELARSFDKYPEWLAGERQPTLKQLEDFAKKTHAPLGYLLLDEPPDEPVPVADFRVVAGTDRARPSPNLLDTLYACQIRQEWYRDDALSQGEGPVPWVASLNLDTRVDEAAALLRDQLGWGAEVRGATRSTQEAWAELRARNGGARNPSHDQRPRRVEYATNPRCRRVPRVRSRGRRCPAGVRECD